MATAHQFQSPANAEQLVQEWGWQNAPIDVLQIAARSLHAQQTMSGQILVDWDVIDSTSRDRLLQRKSDDTPTLQYFAEQDPVRVLQHVEQILALKNAYPFYERLSLLAPHQEMDNALVVRRCEELDAVLMLIENQTPVLVFARWDALLNYSTMGKTQCLTDAIVHACAGARPQLAVGARDDISAMLKQHHERHVDDDDEVLGGRVWHVKANDPNSTPEEREISRIFDHALAEKATDIALIPLNNGALEVYIRKWGILIPPFKKARADGSKKTVIGAVIAAKVINLLQSRSGANADRTRLREPDDGYIKYRSATADAFMRLNFIPLNHLGEYKELRSVSIRLFPRAEHATRLLDLHIPPTVAQFLRDAVQAPQGLILLSGPVNQGKSSTVGGTIAEHVEIYGESKKRMAVEDPIEREIDGVTQIQAPSHIKDAAQRFNLILRALKRHDFNLLFVGEIRDAETADFAVRFSGSGHLVLSTIHAKNSILAYSILSEMVERELRFQLIEALSLSVSQRLVSTVCTHCAILDSTPTDEEARLFALNLQMLGEEHALPTHFTRANQQGCDECQDGYAGSLPICEVLPFTRQVKDAIHTLTDGGTTRIQRKLIAEARPVTLLQSSLALVREGRVDLRSVLFL